MIGRRGEHFIKVCRPVSWQSGPCTVQWIPTARVYGTTGQPRSVWSRDNWCRKAVWWLRIWAWFDL